VPGERSQRCGVTQGSAAELEAASRGSGEAPAAATAASPEQGAAQNHCVVSGGG